MITVETTRTGGEVVLAVSGEVDLDTAEELREAVLGAVAEAAGSTQRVRVDLRGVAFLNSSGISALLAGLRDADARGVHYAVSDVQPAVRKVIGMVGLADVLIGPGSDVDTA